ncbi:MAG: M20/M25/M40 family metallo-hydrolase [Bacteroidales bacterium]|nr:M20/M25/M40 family metallo-hydrolase [Bacteroidales bacterium]
MKKILIFISLIISITSCNQVKIDNPEITKAELREHIEFLASDSLKGRLPGTPEGLIAAQYIGNKLEQFGFTSIADNGYQYFDVVTEVIAGDKNTLEFDDFAGTLNDNFIPYNYSANQTLEANVTFAGYGFDIETDNIKWNDYKDPDITGKWVMIFRADPELKNPDSEFIRYSNERSKVLTAKDHGAAGVLLVSGYELDKKDELTKLEKDQTESNLGIPVFHIKRDIADKILSKSGKTIADLEKQLNKNMTPISFDCDVTLKATSDVNFKKVKTQNVIAMLPGNDPILKNEFIVIGGHYDHLGFGGPSTSSRMPDSIAVHFGADDNASGIASIIEIAEKLADNKNHLQRSVIIIAFGAEEIGTIGSSFFTSNPVVDLKQIKAMVNIDMVGRLKESKDLFVGGVGTSVESEKLLNNLVEGRDLNLGISYNGFGPSDHSAFYVEDIPVFFFSTGAHPDYHTPLDVIDKLNFEGLKVLTDYIYDLSIEILNRDQILTFQESGPKGKSTEPTRGSKVKLGIMPNFGKSDNNGLRIDGVTPGGTAYNGGLLKNDVIVAIEGKSIHNIYEYMSRMGALKPGQTITIDVMREGKKEVFIVQLDE